MAAAFWPVDIPEDELEIVQVTLDEFEAIRLADLDGLYQEKAALQMKVSRATFSRIVESAHRKIADALIHGKAIRIEGGAVVRAASRRCCHAHQMKFPTIQKRRRRSMTVLCVPISENLGLKSPVCAHFGSAPMFMIVDSSDRSFRIVENKHRRHGHGGCAPLETIAKESYDALVVGGIGAGALARLQTAGIQVLKSDYSTVEETVEEFKAKKLQPIDPTKACAGHDHDHS